jgi:hypothetical protein
LWIQEMSLLETTAGGIIDFFLFRKSGTGVPLWFCIKLQNKGTQRWQHRNRSTCTHTVWSWQFVATVQVSLPGKHTYTGSYKCALDGGERPVSQAIKWKNYTKLNLYLLWHVTRKYNA